MRRAPRVGQEILISDNDLDTPKDRAVAEETMARVRAMSVVLLIDALSTASIASRIWERLRLKAGATPITVLDKTPPSFIIPSSC